MNLWSLNYFPICFAVRRKSEFYIPFKIWMSEPYILKDHDYARFESDETNRIILSFFKFIYKYSSCGRGNRANLEQNFVQGFFVHLSVSYCESGLEMYKWTKTMLADETSLESGGFCNKTLSISQHSSSYFGSRVIAQRNFTCRCPPPP